MIEIGKKYTLYTLYLTDDGYDKEYRRVTVTGKDGTLVELDNHEIINTASPMFYSLIDTEGQKAFHKSISE